MENVGNETFINLFSREKIDAFQGQFICHKDTKLEQENWNHLSINGWLLEAHSSLNMVEVFFNEDRVGLIVGYPVYKKRLLSINERITLFGEFDTRIKFQELLKEISGRYVALLLTNSLEYVFPDAVATLTVVYDLTSQFIASSTFLFPKETKKANEELIKTCKQSEEIKGSFYPCGLTYFDNLKVLKPNFCINLKTMKEERFEVLISQNQKFDFYEIASSVADEVQSLVEFILERFSVEVFLTAGKDSRLVLASLRETCKRVVYSTYFENAINGSHYINYQIASLMANDLGLKYSAHDLSKSIQCTTSPDNVVIVGYGGELSRGHLWKNEIINSKRVTVENVISLLGYPNSEIICNEIENWLGCYSTNSPNEILDFLYLEFYMGFLTSPSLYRYDCFSKFAVAPLCSWNIMKLFLNLSWEVKANDKFTRRFLNEFMPLSNLYVFA